MSAKISSAILVLITLTLTSLNGQAQLYKWVDENGKIHYSDKEPDKKADSKVIKQKQNNSSQFPNAATASTKPIIRPYEKTARKLHLLDTRYLWKSESHVNQTSKVGVFHSGKGCTSRGAMNTPDVFVYHKSLFPSEADLTHRINKIINGLDYDAERTEKYRLLGRLKKTGGLSLHAEIVDMDFKTCAPGIRKSERLKRMENISAHRFTKHRVKLQVNWQLRSNRDQDVIYEATTAGRFNGWSHSTSSKTAISNALESAVLTLFSEQDFIARILVEEDGSGIEDLEYASLKPISSEQKTRTRKLYLLANGKDWIKGKETQAEIGQLLFGEKCAAKAPMPLGIALNRKKWLAADANRTNDAIIKKTRPLGYSISPASSDTLTKLENSGGYSLNARITGLTYDACAPSLAASTKYKPVDKIAFKRLSRNRVQVWIEWTLKSDRNRKLLYRTSTMGFAGSLLTDNRGEDAMSAALGMAAEQLFADRDFIELITLKPRDPAPAQRFTARDNSSVKGIVMASDQKATRLIVVSGSSPWSRIAADKSVGFYAYGSECTPFKERNWPQALNDHPRIFPDAGEIASAESKVVKSLGYPSQVADEYSVVSIKRKLGAYSLHGHIVDIRFDSCAPELSEDIVYSNRKISSSQFKRHRIILRIDWKLVGTDQGQVLFRKMTEGVADSWLLNAGGKKVFSIAIENATSQLFAEPGFVASLVTDKSPEQKGFFSGLLSFLDSQDSGDSTSIPGATSRYLLQAHAAQVFSEISVVKVGSLQHYMMEGDWPHSLPQIGISDSTFNNSEAISHVNLQPDGSIVVELKELFGSDKIITLNPESSNGDVSMNRWHCSSNLDSAYLPQNCEGL
ncbi:MAG: DUF4124 domain-containing protein [Gammaproteobacteria bacterium]|nr:DUF4124 domain-containing protein [Gammaproteobacteria bacterium]